MEGQTITFISVYRGETVETASLIALTTDAGLIAHVAATLLERSPASDARDPIVNAVGAGRRQALRLIRDEAVADEPAPDRGVSATSAPATPMRRVRLRTPRPEAFCPAPRCGKRFTPSPRLRGDPQKFCSDRCRSADHRARRRARQEAEA